MIISVASGKGGTGKTTVATNLAVSLGTKVCLLDCDVEEPNAHLFINPVIEDTRTVTTPVPEINQEKCTYCGECAKICQFRAIIVLGKAFLTFDNLCHSCGGCMRACPEGAIRWRERELGTIRKGRRNGLEFADGILRIGEAMSPPLIKEVRAQAGRDSLVIIDAPPGTSCPVIAAMKGSDFVLLVTEPTPFGLHDLKLAVGAVRILNIPCGLVINRSDMGDEKVKEYATEESIPILMEIPFDRGIAESYSRGEILVEHASGWKEKFLELYQQIEEIVKRGQN
jgi:MinD superfamily P-loop ATPase